MIIDKMMIIEFVLTNIWEVFQIFYDYFTTVRVAPPKWGLELQNIGFCDDDNIHDNDNDNEDESDDNYDITAIFNGSFELTKYFYLWSWWGW